MYFYYDIRSPKDIVYFNRVPLLLDTCLGERLPPPCLCGDTNITFTIT